MSDKKERWSISLNGIVQDVEKGADRFVRLNAQTTRKLKILFAGIESSPSILEVRGYNSADIEKKATYEDVVVWIDELRESISVLSFFESIRGI